MIEHLTFVFVQLSLKVCRTSVQKLRHPRNAVHVWELGVQDLLEVLSCLEMIQSQQIELREKWRDAARVIQALREAARVAAVTECHNPEAELWGDGERRGDLQLVLLHQWEQERQQIWW